jgi:hypothetical protein
MARALLMGACQFKQEWSQRPCQLLKQVRYSGLARASAIKPSITFDFWDQVAANMAFRRLRFCRYARATGKHA